MLVILGLLVGGVLSGQSLIRAAELRSVSADFVRYQTAIQAFRDKYFALPGDMANATQFWGAINADPSICWAGPATSIATCNGNGNGVIAPGMSTGPDTSYNEQLRAWQHLGNAQLVEGTYTGAVDGTSDFATLGRDLPRSRINNAGFAIARGLGDVGLPTYSGAVDPAQSLLFGAPTDGFSIGFEALKPEDAFNIDTKIDDGRPGTGRVLGGEANGNCVTTNVASTSAYELAQPQISCSLLYAL